MWYSPCCFLEVYRKFSLCLVPFHVPRHTRPDHLLLCLTSGQHALITSWPAIHSHAKSWWHLPSINSSATFLLFPAGFPSQHNSREVNQTPTCMPRDLPNYGAGPQSSTGTSSNMSQCIIRTGLWKQRVTTIYYLSSSTEDLTSRFSLEQEMFYCLFVCFLNEKSCWNTQSKCTKAERRVIKKKKKIKAKITGSPAIYIPSTSLS